ncbi:MAG: pyroglutamyl-peptidase I [Hyphomicrobiaceae bacterium]|nr:pyroglutamyl-peptidase I [Hyphomicrobiaceae bacterium]MCC0008618.1 pyroglutamyl-peptidase I [Hyphomicrobiaceae bacterium]
MTTTTTRSVLITGFGPFPGVAENVSATLASRLAETARQRWPVHQFTSAVLPTEWHAGPATLDRLWTSTRPDIALHFGVAAEACGLQLEAVGSNQCRIDPDAAGLLPLTATWRADGPQICQSSLPLGPIRQALQAMGLPSCISEDAGAYLCNAILYDSAHRAAVCGRPTLAGFVHIPTVLGESDTDTHRLSFADAVTGGLTILACSLDALDKMGGKAPNVVLAERPREENRRG